MHDSLAYECQKMMWYVCVTFLHFHKVTNACTFISGSDKIKVAQKLGGFINIEIHTVYLFL